MKCPRCGKIIPGTIYYCSYCGAAVSSAQPSSPVPPASPAPLAGQAAPIGRTPIISPADRAVRRRRRAYLLFLLPTVACVAAGGLILARHALPPSFTVPPSPRLSSPASGAEQVPVTPRLAWEPARGATGYRLQVSLEPGFANPVCDWSELTEAWATAGPLAGGATYWWRVAATGQAGPGAWSDAWTFTTVAVPPPAPTLSSPADRATGLPTTPRLKWNASSRATAYCLNISTDPGFSNLVASGVYSATSAAVPKPLARGTRYWWRVSASSQSGVGPWSAAWSFTTQGGPSPPALSAPADGAGGLGSTPLLAWKTASGAVSYQVQVSRDAGFAAVVFDQSGLSGTSVTVTALTGGTRYWWWVRAQDSRGTASAWSAARTFTTGAVPPAPRLVAPRYGALDIPTSPLLMWSASPGAVSYRVQVSSHPAFGQVVFDRSGVRGTSVVATGLAAGTEYWWRVSASNAAGASDWSPPAWNFTTVSP